MLSIVFLVFSCGTATVAAASKRCEDAGPDWKQFGYSCYRVHLQELTFDQAVKLCEVVGSAPTSIHSSGEQEFINSLVQPYVSHLTPIPGHSDYLGLWIGMKQRPFGNIYQFEWLDGGAISYTNWDKDQPSNGGVHDASNPVQSCAQLVEVEGGVFRWDDQGCAIPIHGVICERKLDV